MASSAFPALAINTQGESPINTFAKIEQIRGLQQSQQLGAIQLQEARVAQQSREALMTAWAKNNGDMNQTLADARESGKVTPTDLLNFQEKAVALQTQAALSTKAQLEVADKQHDLIANELEGFKALPVEQRTPQRVQDIAGRLGNQGIDISKIMPALQSVATNPSDSNIRNVEIPFKGAQWVNDNALKQLELESKPTAQQAQQKTQAELSEAADKAKAAHIALLSMPTPEEAHTERAAKLLQTQAQTAQAQADTAFKKVQTQLASAEPVFAYDPATKQRVQATMPEAKAKGYTDIVPVKETDIDKASERTQQFNDVQMNVSRYRNAFKNAPLVTPEQAKLMATIKSDKDTMGLLEKLPAAGITGDVIKTKLNSDAWNHLTKENQDLMIGYLRTTGAVGAFQRGLTQGGRISPELMHIEVNNVPLPMEGATVGLKRLDAFQENIDTAVQGTVRVKGLPTPHEIRQAIEGAEQPQQPDISQGIMQNLNRGVDLGRGLPALGK